MPKTTRIFLFDIDGVLIQPGGYRAAVRATLGYFLNQMGLPESLAPDDAIMSFYEANRITSEWDMTPISLAIILEAVISKLTAVNLSGDLPQVLSAIQSALPAQGKIWSGYQDLPYIPVIEQIGSAYQTGETPSLTALRLADQASGGSLFPHLSGSPILTEMFSATRDWERSWITRIFQHFTLGSAAFELCYHRPAEIQTPGLIPLYDTPLLSAALTEKLREGNANGQFHLAAYTLRASLPPREIPMIPPGYSPEAETALQIANLLDIPLIGYGRLDYLARVTDEDINHYLKPSPIQALASILAALTQNELDAVIQAREFVLENEIPHYLKENPTVKLEIHVFEDSRGGIEAISRAVELLDAAGIVAEMVAWGISDNNHKRKALAEVTQHIFSSTSTALQAALELVG